MFALLRENGIAARLDENIGIDFINMNRTSRALDNYTIPEESAETSAFLEFQRPLYDDVNDAKAPLDDDDNVGSFSSEELRSLAMQSELEKARSQLLASPRHSQDYNEARASVKTEPNDLKE